MRRDNIVFWVLVGLVVVQVVYAGYWALHDISARLGMWSDAGEADAFIASLTALQETLFFSHVVMNVVVLGLVLARRWLALPAFILSFLLDRAEWVMMSGNVVFSNMVAVDTWAVFSFTLQGTIIALLVALTFEERLR
jgi:hypothetical protein